MRINYTKTYRLWFVLTTIGAFGMLLTYFFGYDTQQGLWNTPFHTIHALFTGVLFGAVTLRVYMAVNNINPVPLVHLLRAKTILEGMVALAYIGMCSALLITVGTEIYLLMAVGEKQALWVEAVRNTTQPVFAVLIALHLLYVLYLNGVKKRGTLYKLLHAQED